VDEHDDDRSTTSLYLDKSSFEMFILIMSTCTIFAWSFLSVIQFLGYTKICSAAKISIFVTGQFVRRLFSTRWMKSFVLGLPIIR